MKGEAGVLPIGCFPILHFELRLGDALFHFFAEAVDEILLVPGLLFRVETGKHFLRFHFLFSFQVLDGLIDGADERLRAGQVLPEDLPVRLEGGDFFEIAPAEDLPDLLQLEAQLPIEQDLLEG